VEETNSMENKAGISRLTLKYDLMIIGFISLRILVFFYFAEPGAG
jgi:hypothetical protein